MNKPKQYQQGWTEFYKQSLKNSTKNIPKAYEKGYVEFYKLKFKVTPDVLIPRPETELLVDKVLECINSTKGKDILVMDVGTGSGNIAISIACNAPNVQIIATDISQKALAVAQQNAKLHGVRSKIKFIQSNLLENPSLLATDYQLLIIVTNLPYIPTGRINYLDSSVKDFEPHLALDGGQDGFDLYRKLFDQIKEKRLKPDLLLGEIDYLHGDIAYIEAQKYFSDYKIEVKKDLAHLQRILIIEKLKRQT